MRLPVSLSLRIGMAAMLLVAAGVWLFLTLIENQWRQSVLSNRSIEVENSLNLHASQIRQTVETLRQDTLFLSKVPPIDGIIRATYNRGTDPLYKNSLASWRQRLQDIFRAFGDAHPHYSEIRFIGLDNRGLELVRVDRLSGKLEVIPESGLQHKEERYYFQATRSLADGEVYLSEIDLHQEHGRIFEPHKRTLRAGTPVFDAQGKLFGMVLLNLDIGILLDKLQYDEPVAGMRSFIADRFGRFILHPDSAREFAFEFGKPALMDAEFPELKKLTDPASATNVALRQVSMAGEAAYVAAKRVQYDPGDPSRFMVLMDVLPAMAIEVDVAKGWHENRAGVLLIALGAGIAVLVGLHFLLRPLRQITDVARQIADGVRDVKLPEVRQGDIGALTGAFRIMLGKVVEREADLERRVRERTAELRLAAAVFDNTDEGVAVCDEQGVFVSVNRAFTEITGYSAEEAIGQRPSLLRSDHHDREFYRNMWESILATGVWQGEIWNRRKDGEAYLEWLTINRIPAEDGIPAAYVSVFTDITELHRKDERIRHLAYHDALTGLPNRSLLQDRLQHAIERADREGKRLALMFIDLDRFKAVNDTLGHEVGDLLLKQAAARLRGCLRISDTVARMGGDEFVVMLEDVVANNHVADVAVMLIETMAKPMHILDHEVQVGASVGIALCPDDGNEVLELMKRADMAMYAAKTAGRNTYRFFRTEMTEETTRRHQLEVELRHAIANGELELHYQPKVSLDGGGLRGVEALVRWRHPHLGLVPPGDFIPVAEESGLIADLGDWVLERACNQAIEWKARGLDFGIAVNVSAKQLERGDLVERITALAACRDIKPTCLQIELTESVLMADPESAIEQLQQLRRLGVTIAVDDFGTGYSSLAYLRRLPIDVLKIDRSFVMDADRNEEAAQVVRTIVALGQSLKLTVVAEGVETEAQAEMLRQAGCHVAQGYLFSHPRPADRLEAWLAGEATVRP